MKATNRFESTSFSDTFVAFLRGLCHLWGKIVKNQIVEGYRMNVADKICEKAKDLPEPFAREVLAFIERIIAHRDPRIEGVKKVQESAMKRIWENTEDDIWNEL